MNCRALLFLGVLLARALPSSSSSNATQGESLFHATQDEANATAPHLRGSKGSGDDNNKWDHQGDDLRVAEDDERELTLNVLNLSYMQPLGAFFVLVHDSRARPLYVLGETASQDLAVLAEYGRPEALDHYYEKLDPVGVKSVERFDATTRGGETSRIKVRVSDRYPMVSIAAKCENTNDCFVALNGATVKGGRMYDIPGLDAGSEENNESCDSVPGPACTSESSGRSGMERSFNGEGYVHVHRGVLGVRDLERGLDWKNPMIRVTVTEE